MGYIGKPVARRGLQEISEDTAVPEIVPEPLEVPPAEYVTAIQGAVASRLREQPARLDR
jgi:hypothetical protein